jgi:competence protein ComEA
MKKIINKIGLTKRELIIIGFLFIAFTAGLILKYSGWKKPAEYDYSESDEKFSKQIKSAFTELEKNNLTDEQKQKSDEIKKLSDSLITEADKPGVKPELRLTKKININTAYAGDLQLLPGIGEVTAGRIIDYRERNGPFKKPEDIKKVKGIRDKKFEQIKDYIVVE